MMPREGSDLSGTAVLSFPAWNSIAWLAVTVGEDFCTRGNLFQILLIQTEIGLYLPCTDWFGTQTDTSICVPNQSETGKYNQISG